MSKYTVTIWETDFHTGAFVSGVEKFDCIVEARQYFQSYFGEKNLQVVLEQGNRKLAEISPNGHLYALNGVGTIKSPVAQSKWDMASEVDFHEHTHDLKKKLNRVKDAQIDRQFAV